MCHNISSLYAILLYVVGIYIHETTRTKWDSCIVLIKVRRFLNFCLIEKPKYNNNKVLCKMENINLHSRYFTSSDNNDATSES